MKKQPIPIKVSFLEFQLKKVMKRARCIEFPMQPFIIIKYFTIGSVSKLASVIETLIEKIIISIIPKTRQDPEINFL